MIDEALTPITVNDFINDNIPTIVNQVFPLQNFGFLRFPTLITMDLHYFLLTIIQLEYGDFYLVGRETRQFKNTYTESFFRMLQLMTLDQIVDMNTLLRNQFQSEEYVANASHSASISDTSVSGNENVQGQSQGFNTGNTSGNQSTVGSSRENVNITTENISENTFDNESKNNTESNRNTLTGPITNMGTQLNIPLPDQSLIGTTNLFADKLGTEVDGVGVPQLNMSYTDGANQSNNFTSSQTGNEDSTSLINTMNTGTSNDISNSNTQNTSNASTDSTTSHTYNNQIQIVDTGSTTITSNGNTENSGKTGSSSFVGSRRKGFTTNAIVASQLLAMFRGYQEINTAVEWWIEQFRWIQPIIGVNTWDSGKEKYV